MRKVTKIRSWLIKKLGGSDAPLYPLAPQPSKIEERVDMIPVRAVATCRLESVNARGEEIQNMLRTKIAEEIGNALLEQGHIRFEDQEDYTLSEYRLSGTVTLAKRERDND